MLLLKEKQKHSQDRLGFYGFSYENKAFQAWWFIINQEDFCSNWLSLVRQQTSPFYLHPGTQVDGAASIRKCNGVPEGEEAGRTTGAPESLWL